MYILVLSRHGSITTVQQFVEMNADLKYIAAQWLFVVSDNRHT